MTSASRLIDAGPAANNTIVVLWGDHGWHLVEKQHWGKWTGWDRSTHVPLVIAPARNDASIATPARSNQTVSLLDLYSTLVDLCGLSPRNDLSGQSLVPLLRNPGAVTGRSVICTFEAGNHAVINTQWRYIRYADGSEELYDRTNDPYEWTNLASRPEHQELKQHLPRLLPADNRRKSER